MLSHDQRDDLTRQADRLAAHAVTDGGPDPEIITDRGSGLNYRNRRLQRLIRMICRREVGTLVLTHKDRLLRFGAALIFTLCGLCGVWVVIIEDEPDRFEDRLAGYVIDLITVFSARLYGRRSHQNRKVAAC